MSKTKNPGFTLIELLVVIAIIGLLSVVAVVALNSSRVKARNAKRLVNIEQFATALELYNSKYGSFPLSAATNASEFRCLGAYEGTDCWNPLGLVYEDATLKAALPEFVQPIPADYVKGTGTFVREGFLYQGNNKNYTGTNLYCSYPNTAMIIWFMEGIKESCGKGKSFNCNNSGNTACAYCFGDNYNFATPANCQ